MKRFFLILTAFLALVGCTSTSSKTDATSATDALSVTFTEKNFVDNERIVDADTIKAEMSFRFPFFTGGNETVNKKINDYIFELAQFDMFGEEDSLKKSYKSLDEIAKDFFMQAKESENPDFPFSSAWYSSFETDTLLLDTNKNRLTLIHNFSTFTGGAHPNYVIQLSNIDLNSGEVIPNEELFGNSEELLKAVEKRFIENEKQELGGDFSMENYWFDNGFILPNAMGITPEGILCIYSPYEVSSYARGAIQFVVPFKDVPFLKF